MPYIRTKIAAKILRGQDDETACVFARRLFDSGQLAGIRLGERGDRWFDEESVRQFVARGEVEAAERRAEHESLTVAVGDGAA